MMCAGPLITAVAILCAVVAPAPAHAQDYPSKPIKLIVPTAAAGIGDIIARQMQQTDRLATHRHPATPTTHSKCDAARRSLMIIAFVQ